MEPSQVWLTCAIGPGARRLAYAVVMRNFLGTHLLGRCGVGGALFRWFLLAPIATALGALAGAVYEYYIYVICWSEI